MKQRIALFYHLNLSHYSLTPFLRRLYLREGIKMLAESIKVPVNFSLSAQDLEEIYNKSKCTYKVLFENQFIKFHLSSYSHFLPRDFPKDIDSQLHLGIKTFERLIPKEKILDIGLFAEFDLPKYEDELAIVSKYVKYLLTNYTLIDHSDFKACPGLYKYNLGNGSIRLVCIHKGTFYRKEYHRYLRELSNTDDVINAIGQDRITGDPTVCHVDFEAPIINIVETIKNSTKTKSPPRYDLFQKLQDKFESSNLEFVHLSSALFDDRNYIPQVSSFNELSLQVKRNDYYYKLVGILNDNRNLLLKKSNRPNYMKAINSDNFVFNQKGLKLQGYYDGVKGEINIKRSGNRKKIMDSILKELGIVVQGIC
ncbi:hypothetical protein CO178_00030 [candidate division WWE3 bacterium CG_4_9_14_3_um_filter_34_6]|uniref:Glycoside hydrolase family 57 N-terminal domain-containing protein n=1 Tax=candidate division WWE3 bacterium CG_4_9_14_3_um_filter_34_6 TaxID=1975079 RepID=A0A2M7X5M9_UNCKA|nr:MAG: hypothetical protein CO178_00030 [candidate division WWE3 bacterium CG_4_9_14_3_um_filter_34_6]